MGGCARCGIAAALLLALAGCAASGASVPDVRQTVVDRIVASTAKVLVERGGRRVGAGSGVVVASKTEDPGSQPVSYILTSAHLLDGKDDAQVFVRFTGAVAPGRKLGAGLVLRGNSSTQDLALLRVPGVAAPPVDIGDTEDARLGEDILVVGFPWGRRLGLFSGIVSEVPTDSKEKQEAAAGEGTEDSLMVDAVAANGVSGGGVFRAGTGELLGVVEGFGTASVAVREGGGNYSVRVPMPGETFVVPLAKIRQFLKAAGVGSD